MELMYTSYLLEKDTPMQIPHGWTNIAPPMMYPEGIDTIRVHLVLEREKVTVPIGFQPLKREEVCL